MKHIPFKIAHDIVCTHQHSSTCFRMLQQSVGWCLIRTPQVNPPTPRRVFLGHDPHPKSPWNEKSPPLADRTFIHLPIWNRDFVWE